MKIKLPLIILVSLVVITLIVTSIFLLLNNKSDENPTSSSVEPSFITPKMEVSPYRVEDNTAVFKFTALPDSNITQIKVTTDLKKTAEWINVVTFIKIPVSDLGDSGNIYVQGKTSSGELTEIITDTINPNSPPVGTLN